MNLGSFSRDCSALLVIGRRGRAAVSAVGVVARFVGRAWEWPPVFRVWRDDDRDGKFTQAICRRLWFYREVS